MMWRVDISKLPRMSKTTTPPNEAGPDVPPPADAAFPVVPTSDAAQSTWCIRCNAPNPAGTRFCGSCGAELTPGARAFPGRVDVQPGVGAEVWVSAIVG